MHLVHRHTLFLLFLFPRTYPTFLYTTQDFIGGYHCTCPAGFTGNDCQTNIDDCASNMCHSNNTHECVDGINSYTCVCQPGYTGQLCDIEIDECNHASCMNGGTCLDLLNDFSCQCPIGFTGAVCATNIDDCHPGFCLFNGTCIDEVKVIHCCFFRLSEFGPDACISAPLSPPHTHTPHAHTHLTYT